MRRIDHGVFESVDGTPYGGLEGERAPRSRRIDDLVGFIASPGLEVYGRGGADRAASVIKQWADSDAALLGEAATIARRDDH
jgi:hypothetical protein